MDCPVSVNRDGINQMWPRHHPGLAILGVTASQTRRIVSHVLQSLLFSVEVGTQFLIRLAPSPSLSDPFLCSSKDPILALGKPSNNRLMWGPEFKFGAMIENFPW